MKLFLASLLLSVSAFAANKVVETGSYTAVDTETKTIIASLEVRDNKTLNFKVKTPDFTMPEPGCEGTYDVQENMFISDLKCPLDFLSQVHVEIDITNVTPDNVRSPAGVDVDVTIDALGTDSFKFNLKKVK
jgi:hypothetical protein